MKIKTYLAITMGETASFPVNIRYSPRERFAPNESARFEPVHLRVGAARQSAVILGTPSVAFCQAAAAEGRFMEREQFATFPNHSPTRDSW